MTNEDLAVRIQAGERERLPELWDRVERFAAQQARRTAQAAGPGADWEDLYQCGYLALAEAVEDYNRDRGSFLTWFGFFLQTAFAEETGYRTQRQRRDPLRGAISLDDPVPGTDDLLLSDTVADSEDRIADTEDAIWWDELHTAMLEALGSLPPDCRDILRRRFYQLQTLARAAQETGRTQNRVRQIEAIAIRQLRHPRIARNLQPFAYPDGDIYAAGLRGTGLSVFRRSGESSVERAVFWMERGSGQ